MNLDHIRVQAAGIFLRAAAYIRQYGWQEEGMGESGGPRCSMGALDSAMPDRRDWNERLSELMYETLYTELNGLSLTGFNRRFRSGEQVARLYERTAARLNV